MQEIFSKIAEQDGITCKIARGISVRSGKEFHLFHEIIYFLDGDAEFISENLHMHLQPETLIVIPRETYHQMILHGDQQRYYRCLLQFDLSHTPPTEVIAIRADEEIRYLFGKLMSGCDEPGILQSVLTLLLGSLKSKKELIGKEIFQIDLIRQVTDYINQNIHSKLLICDIAAACNVSCSTLCHVFKKEMNIPIHKFIIKKRLISAHHLIASGVSATTAAQECGFHDYSGFYKQYKMAFGFSPSQRHS